jgi:CheY-like chemotaxis protein
LIQNSFDVALLDMNYTAGATTGQEGFDLLNYLITNSSKTRVVMMTAYGDIDLAIKAIKEGAVDFIVKPWDNAKLVNTVISAFKKVPETVNNTKSTGSRRIVSKPKQWACPRWSGSSCSWILHLPHPSLKSLATSNISSLLNDFFMDIAAPIEDHHGEIYQYIGDEVVISWPLTEGIRDFNVLHCFFDIVDTMKDCQGIITNGMICSGIQGGNALWKGIHRYNRYPEKRDHLYRGCTQYDKQD